MGHTFRGTVKGGQENGLSGTFYFCDVVSRVGTAEGFEAVLKDGTKLTVKFADQFPYPFLNERAS